MVMVMVVMRVVAGWLVGVGGDGDECAVGMITMKS